VEEQVGEMEERLDHLAKTQEEMRAAQAEAAAQAAATQALLHKILQKMDEAKSVPSSKSDRTSKK
jgi:hypothetical protein